MKDLIRKILKESEEDFDWVPNVGELELVRDNAHRHEIIMDLIDKVKKYNGWTITIESDGVVYWSGNGEYTGMATPEWDEDFFIPVDIMWENDYANVTEIHTPHFKYVIEVVDWYSNNYFKLVDEALTNYIEKDNE